MWRGAVAVLAAGLALAACATSPSSPSGHATAQDLFGLNNIQDVSGINKRDLTPEEKQVISKAVGLSVVNPNAAQYRWPQIANTEDGSINYCGMVNAKSSFPAYSGWQAYIVEGTISGGKMTSAVVGLIAGGKDTEIVRKMCKKYGLDPRRRRLILRTVPLHYAALAPEPHNCALASRAPLTKASSLAQATVGWIVIMPANVPNPQSAPAITRSRPTTLA